MVKKSAKTRATVSVKGHHKTLPNGKRIHVNPYSKTVNRFPHPSYVTELTINGRKRLVRVTIKNNKKHYKVIGDLRKVRTSSYLNAQKQMKQLRQRSRGNLRLQKTDWTHLSTEYPNLMGLTDKEINDFIKVSGKYSDNKTITPEYAKEYVKHVKCLDDTEIKQISRKMFETFRNKMMDKNYSENWASDNKFLDGSTIYLTSPRGGFNILSDFGYANASHVEKRNFPYDLYTTPNKTLGAESLPYSNKIYDVNDIVFIDDILMSGEQCRSAHSTLTMKIKEMNIYQSQIPRLHYMAIIGNKDQDLKKLAENWSSITIGELHDFKEENDKFVDISAVAFPWSIPDGDHHYLARKLYSTVSNPRYGHRTY